MADPAARPVPATRRRLGPGRLGRRRRRHRGGPGRAPGARSTPGLLPAEVLDSFDADQFAAAWHEAMSRPADARNRVLVALERNTVRGFAVTGPSPDPDSDPVADGEISELVVDPGHGRAGHGSRLLHACVDTLRADRFTRATTWLAVDGRRRGAVPHRGGLGARRRPPGARPARRRLGAGQAGAAAHRRPRGGPSTSSALRAVRRFLASPVGRAVQPFRFGPRLKGYQVRRRQRGSALGSESRVHGQLPTRYQVTIWIAGLLLFGSLGAWLALSTSVPPRVACRCRRRARRGRPGGRRVHPPDRHDEPRRTPHLSAPPVRRVGTRT